MSEISLSAFSLAPEALLAGSGRQEGRFQQDSLLFEQLVQFFQSVVPPGRIRRFCTRGDFKICAKVGHFFVGHPLCLGFPALVVGHRIIKATVAAAAQIGSTVITGFGSARFADKFDTGLTFVTLHGFFHKQSCRPQLCKALLFPGFRLGGFSTGS